MTAATDKHRDARLRAVHPHEALVRRFYAAFAARDAEGMVACYHPDVEFQDPVFGELRGKRAKDMWRMLLARGKDLRVETQDVAADDREGRATWIATYTFGKRRRLVRNVIHARFTFEAGLIRRHVDSFSVWRWAGMAMGAPGWLLGWAPPLQERIRREARKGLDAFRAPQG